MQGTILTDIGRVKLASATPEDQLYITHMAVGDGNGGYPDLTGNMTALTNEVYRSSVSAPIRDDNNPAVLIFEMTIPAGEGGFFIREAAVFDSGGDMIAIGHTSLTEKPSPDATTALTLTIRLYIAFESTQQITLINEDGSGFDHQGLSNRDATDAHPASSISVSIVPDVLASDNVQDALEELATFDNTNTYLTATTPQGALETLGSSYVFVDQVLGDKYTHGNVFDDVDVFDDLLGKVYDGTATAQEIATVDKVNTKLGLLAQ